MIAGRNYSIRANDDDSLAHSSRRMRAWLAGKLHRDAANAARDRSRARASSALQKRSDRSLFRGDGRVHAAG